MDAMLETRTDQEVGDELWKQHRVLLWVGPVGDLLRRHLSRHVLPSLVVGEPHGRHLIMVIVVPVPTSLTTSNSSINRRAPGNPSPRPR